MAVLKSLIESIQQTESPQPSILVVGGQRAKNYGRTNSKDKTGHEKRIYRM